MRFGLLLANILAAGLAPIAAQAAEPSGCDGFKWHIDREQTAFAGQGLPTISAGAEIPGVMEAVVLHLAKQDGQTFPVPPTHKPRHDPAFAGVFPMIFMQVPGPYNITISDAAWIDVVQDGKLVRQTGYTGATGCHDVRKSVQFQFAKGPATIMITDAATDTLKLEVLPPPPTQAQ